MKRHYQPPETQVVYINDLQPLLAGSGFTVNPEHNKETFFETSDIEDKNDVTFD
mgnify:CR=1 FL=1